MKKVKREDLVLPTVKKVVHEEGDSPYILCLHQHCSRCWTTEVIQKRDT